MLRGLREAVFEGTVALVDPEQVIGQEIVGYVNVRPAVLVNVADVHAQAEALGLNACLFRDVREGAVALVAVEAVGAGGLALRLDGPRGIAVALVNRVGQQVKVEVPVLVVVEEGRLRGIARVGEAVFGRCLAEARHALLARALINEQPVAAGVCVRPGHAHVDVHAPVLVDVYRRHTRRPSAFGRCTGGLGHVLELDVAPVEVERIVDHVAGEVEVGPTVPVEVAHAHARAIVGRS